MLKLIAIIITASLLIGRHMQQTSLFLQAAITLVILKAIWEFVLYPKLFSPLRKIPVAKNQKNPKASWLKNYLTEPSHDDLLRYTEENPNEGLLRYTGILGYDRLLLTSAQARKEVFQTRSYEFTKVMVKERVGILTGPGIIVTDGDLHKAHRKGLSPAFSYRQIKDLAPLFWEKALQLARKLNAENGSGEWSTREFQGLALRASFDVIGVAAFGTDFNTIENPDSEVSNMWLSLFGVPTCGTRAVRLFRLTGLIVPWYILKNLPMARAKELKSGVKYMRRVCNDSVQNAKRRISDEKSSKDQSVDILSVALKSGVFDDEQMVDQLMTFLTAGHDTTASTLSWIIYHLCKHPEAQERLRDEIRKKIPSLESDHDIVTEALEDIPYLEAICNETLRLYPTVPTNIRHSPVKTELAGYIIPGEVKLIQSVYALNRSTEIWGQDAERFNPERWLEEGDDGLLKLRNGAGGLYDFGTFSWGPRHCIGEQFARAELRMLIVCLVGKFEWRMSQEKLEAVKKEVGVVLKPEGGLVVNYRLLGGW